PRELSGLPSDLMTHSSVHRDLGQFSGRRVAVIGAGQSALQTAALLHEGGAEVQVIARREAISWETKAPDALGIADYIRKPPNTLCEGWRCVALNSPDMFRLLPERVRRDKGRTTFGPSGAWWLRDRVEGVVDVLTSRRLVAAEARGTGVRLKLDGPRTSIVDADHVIAGTGFRVDTARLPFLSEDIQAGIAKRGDCPVVSRVGESTVPGLYFAGAHTMTSLGPGVRFIAGTHHTSASLARSVARRAGNGRALAEPEVLTELVPAPC
ncbi:MAG: NAD(P)-dependent oxidoreductase, partial [Trebonia sp.]